MNNNVKVPKLRFKGSNDAWVQRKLGDLGSVGMNKRIFKEQTSDVGDVPFYKIGTFGGTPDAFISRNLFEEYKSKYQYPNVGDVLISASGSIGRTVVYQGEDEYFQDSNIVWLKHDSQLDNAFLKQFYSIVKWQGLEGSTIKRLYNKNILETQIWLPSSEEQAKVGEFFDKIDNLIADNQYKVKLLETKKSALADRIFNQRLRFEGFTTPWSQLKLHEAVISEFKGKAKAIMSGEKSAYLDANYLNGGELTFVDFEKDVDRDDVIILWDGSQAGTVYHGFEGALGSTLKAYKPKEDGAFLYQQLKYKQQIIYDRFRTPNIPHVIKSFADEFLVGMTDVDEQQKIGKMFDKMDNLISATQYRGELLKRLKNAYLKQMFI